MREETTVTAVIPRFEAIDRTRQRDAGRSGDRVMSEPGSDGRCVFRIRTGMPLSTAGWSVLGWSTLAPK
jgi:hypothetical protein